MYVWGEGEDYLVMKAYMYIQMYILTQEVQRNVHGVCQVYTFDSELEAFTYPSPWPEVFPDVIHCRVKSVTHLSW